MTGAIIPDDWDGVTYKCYRIEWPASDLWEAILLGQVTIPGKAEYWDEDTGDADDAAEAAVTAYRETVERFFYDDCLEADDMEIVGSIKFWPQQSDPTGWLKCNGAVLSKTTWPELFDVIGYLFGGSGDNYNIPNCAGRVPLHTADIGGTLEVSWTGGVEEHTLTESEMPSHDHDALVASWAVRSGANNYALGSGAASDVQGKNTAVRGGGNAHENMQPYLVLNLIIKVF